MTTQVALTHTGAEMVVGGALFMAGGVVAFTLAAAWAVVGDVRRWLRRR